jgi:hypothetical protein
MSTTTELWKAQGKLEQLRAEHANALMRATAEAELSRDQAWRKRIIEKAASWDRAALGRDDQAQINLCRAFARELRALGSPET